MKNSRAIERCRLRTEHPDVDTELQNLFDRHPDGSGDGVDKSYEASAVICCQIAAQSGRIGVRLDPGQGSAGRAESVGKRRKCAVYQLVDMLGVVVQVARVV
ncbi:hypothetical protein D3C76_1113390 [compost metagenome]